jgi:hypothetical protein
MNDLPVYVFTSDKYLWALKIMLHLYQKYWNWPITVFGFSRPDYELPQNAKFISIGRFSDYPAERWSDGVLAALERQRESHAVVLLEDYWLVRHVNGVAVRSLQLYAEQHPEVGRVDLVTDRLYAANALEVGHFMDLDIMECNPPAQYHMSTQASIWKLDCLRKVLVPGETAWQSELEGTTRMINQGWRAIGTRQCPVRYIIGVQSGKLALDGGYQKPTVTWQQDDLKEVVWLLDKMGKL